jgi:hypothetical protein
MQLKNAAIATLDGDRSFASRELAGRFQPLLRRSAAAPQPGQAVRLLAT